MNIRSYTLLFLTTLAVCCIVAFSYCKQEESEPNTEVADVENQLYDKAINLYTAKNYREAHKLFREAHKQAGSRKASNDISKCLYYLGLTSLYLDDYETALDYFDQYLQYPEPIIPPDKRGKAYSHIATTYQKMGDYEESFNFHMKALSIAEELEKIENIARVNYELGSLFFTQDDYDQALSYYKKAEEMSAPLEKKNIQFTCLAAIGSTYERMENLDTALTYNMKSMEIALESGSFRNLAYANQNIGSNFIKLKRFKEAETALLKSLEINTENESKWAQMGVLRDLGKLFTETSNYNKALNYLQTGLEIAEEAGSKPKKVEFYEALAKTHEAAGNTNTAIAFLRDRISLRDSIMNEKSLATMENLKMIRQFQEKENEINLLEKNHKINRLRMFLMAGFLGFVVILLIFIARSYRKEKHLNQQLEESNHQIQLQNKQLEEINSELKQFTSVASHDLKSPLRTVASFANLLNRRYKDKLDETAQEYLGFIQGGVKRMINMLDDLLSYAKVGKKDIPYEWLESSEMVGEALFNLQENIRQEGATIKVDEKSLPRIKANRTLMVQLFQNLMANAIKFRSSQAPTVWVNCSQNGKNHTFMVKDNGIGIDPEFKDKIFEMFSRVNGKTEYEGTGIGLATCKKIVNNHGGDIWVDSEIGKGCTFYFSVPKLKEPDVEVEA